MDRAYYAMFHGALAALLQDVTQLPTTHSGLRSVFGRVLVETRRVDRSFAKDLISTFDLRQDGTYDVALMVDQVAGEEAVARAEAFTATMRQLLSAG